MKAPRDTLSPLFTWRSAICESDLQPMSRLVAFVLACHMSERGDSCFPKVETLAAEAGITPRSVSEHIARLVAAGYLGRSEHRRGPGRGTRVEYVATCPDATTTRAGTTRAQTTRGRTTRGPVHDHPRFHDTTTRGESAYEEHVSESVSRASGVASAPTKPSTDAARGTRLPDPWPLTDAVRAIAQRVDPAMNVEVEHERFCDYWHAKAGKDARKVDWLLTWRSWCRNAEGYRRTPGVREAAAKAATADDRIEAAMRARANGADRG